MAETRSRTGAVLVTGASSGIGRAVCDRLAAGGRRVFGGVRRAGDAERLRSAGIEAVRLDVTDPASVRDAVRTIEGALGNEPLAGLVNNAGVAAIGPLEQLPLDAFRNVFEVNVLGAAAVTAAFLPRLRAARGRIVMISSVSAVFAAPLFGAYSASKAALETLSDGLRRELRPHGVGVTVIRPGPIRTPIWQKFDAEAARAYKEGPYGAQAAKVLGAVRSAERNAAAPELVARAVVRALEARRAPRIVLVSNRPWFHRLVAGLPRWLGDILVG
ncbi:MAG: SDR family oxidoreductase [Acidobacteria bacterium]|nr:MAG: SDR family oxidoreductase [Acidobacteriota bacterium]